MIEIKEVYLEDALKVHKNIQKFYETFPEKEYFENRYLATKKS